MGLSRPVLETLDRLEKRDGTNPSLRLSARHGEAGVARSFRWLLAVPRRVELMEQIP